MAGSFFDTNIILYLLDDGIKEKTSHSLLKLGGHISVQVLNETLVNCRKKAGLSWQECSYFLNSVERLCSVEPLTQRTHLLGRAVAEKYQLACYDAMVVASALESGCTTLYSEDMHHGLLIEQTLIIENPYR
jgi:predicted nucleic acid-binding protein